MSWKHRAYHIFGIEMSNGLNEKSHTLAWKLATIVPKCTVHAALLINSRECAAYLILVNIECISEQSTSENSTCGRYFSSRSTKNKKQDKCMKQNNGLNRFEMTHNCWFIRTCVHWISNSSLNQYYWVISRMPNKTFGYISSLPIYVDCWTMFI